jgi:predicted esterase
MWSGSLGTLTGAVDRALAALKHRAADVDLSTVVLAGYSLGATAALTMASARNQRFDRLLLLNASLDPVGSSLKQAGIERVALVAGSRDRSRTRLQSAARRLKRFGLEAEFFRLDQTGHFFDGESERRMVEPLQWIGERRSSLVPCESGPKGDTSRR